jgi:hypothetical protein
MNGIGRVLDQAVAELSSHPEDAHSVGRPATVTLEEDLRYSGDGIAPTPGWLLRTAHATREATLIAMRAWVAAGQLGPHRDTSIGRHTGARC